MAIKTSVTCDHCDKELTIDSSYPASYGLQLNCVNFGTNTSGVQYAVHMEPPIRRPHHFCGFGCLKSWIENKGYRES